MALSHHVFNVNPEIAKSLKDLAYYWTGWSLITDNNSYIKSQLRDELCIPTISILANQIANCFPGKRSIASRILMGLINELHDFNHKASVSYLKSRCNVLINCDDEIFVYPFFDTIPKIETPEFLIKVLEDLLLVLTCPEQNPDARKKIIDLFAIPVIEKLADKYSVDFPNATEAKKQIAVGLNYLIDSAAPNSLIYDTAYINQICLHPHIAEEIGFVASTLYRNGALYKISQQILIDNVINFANFFRAFIFKKADAKFILNLCLLFFNEILHPNSQQNETHHLSEYKIPNYPQTILIVDARKLLRSTLSFVNVTQHIKHPLFKECVSTLITALHKFNENQEKRVENLLAANKGFRFSELEMLLLCSNEAIALYKLMLNTQQTLRFKNLDENISTKDALAEEKILTEEMQKLGNALFGMQRYAALQFLVNSESNLETTLPAIMNVENKHAMKLANALTHLKPIEQTEENLKFLFHNVVNSPETLKNLALFLKLLDTWGKFNLPKYKKLVADNVNKFSSDNFLLMQINSQTPEHIVNFAPKVVSLFFHHINPEIKLENNYSMVNNSIFNPEQKVDTSQTQDVKPKAKNFRPSII